MMTRQVTTEIIQPSAVLRPYVHHYCLIKTYHRGISPIIMPTGCMKWIFHRKQPFRVNGETGLTARASICGPYDKAIHLDTQEELEMIMVFFYPYAFHLFTEMPCQLFSNGNVDFDCLENDDFKTLKSCVLEADSAEAGIAYIESFLQRQLFRNHSLAYIKPLVKVFQTIEQNQDVRVEALAETACLSERQFRRVFIEYVGLSPKQLIRIQRFYSLFKELIVNKDNTFDALLYKYGYTDHSHFYREFRQFSGMSPTEFMRYLEQIQSKGYLSAYRSYHNPDVVRKM
ncbi:MAG: helix-turn-helix domain-containing protein [Parabacteroides sp.]